ncbi:MAG: tyrosine-protein phosphatase [Henriciella sp.]|nr:tyrosine-protein phosphatase [Henriciella sp.]
MQDRVKPFENIRNFRDFGGYSGSGGRTIRPGMLYRSAQFGEASETDINQLNALNIVVQADLRRPDERERHGHRWPIEGVEVLSSDKGRETEAPHVNFLSRVSVNAEEARGWMADYYRAAPYKEQHVDTFKAWFDALAGLSDGQAAVVNCAAGKDRTGILCALTHHVLGVSEAEMFADYELTNKAANVETRLTEMARLFNQHIGKDYPEEVYHPFVGVHADFLTAAVDSITAQSGSLDTYLIETLGVEEAQQTDICSRLLA